MPRFARMGWEALSQLAAQDRASMVKRVTTKVIEEVETEDEGDTTAPVISRRSRKGWFIWRGGMLLAILAVLAWFAPTIVATTGLWKPLVGKFVPPLAGRVEAGWLSLGW